MKCFINRFDGGISNDIRDTDTAVGSLIAHFDILTKQFRLTPYKSTESGQDTASRKITDFVYVNSKLFGLGSPSSTATMYYKTTFNDGVWSTTANNVTTIAEAARIDGFLIYYKKTAKIYGCTGSTTVFGYDPTGVAAWVEQTVGSLTSGSCALVHSKDDIMYVGYTNKIATNNNGSWNTTALTLPSNFTITSLSEYGNYLAIGCKSNDPLGSSSRVFLWDRDSSVSTLAESIDWGLGSLQVIEELEGRLVGISLVDNNLGGSLITDSRLSFKYYAGAQGAVEFKSLVSDATAAITTLSTKKQKYNNRLYFLCDMLYTGDQLSGVWSVGSSGPDRPLAVSFDRYANNGTAVTSLEGFYRIGNFMFIAYSGAGAISKSDDATGVSAYTASSIYESQINPAMSLEHRHQKKQLKSVQVSYASDTMVSGAQVVLKFAADTAASVTVFTETTAAVAGTKRTHDASGSQFTAGTEFRFRIESTGGVEITGLEYEYDLLPNQL